jgi:hypothetical protein
MQFCSRYNLFVELVCFMSCLSSSPFPAAALDSMYSNVKLSAASAAFSVVLYGIEFLPETGIFCDWKRKIINVTSDVIIVWGSNALTAYIGVI